MVCSIKIPELFRCLLTLDPLKPLLYPFEPDRLLMVSSKTRARVDLPQSTLISHLSTSHSTNEADYIHCHRVGGCAQQLRGRGIQADALFQLHLVSLRRAHRMVPTICQRKHFFNLNGALNPFFGAEYGEDENKVVMGSIAPADTPANALEVRGHYRFMAAIPPGTAMFAINAWTTSLTSNDSLTVKVRPAPPFEQFDMGGYD